MAVVNPPFPSSFGATSGFQATSQTLLYQPNYAAASSAGAAIPTSGLAEGLATAGPIIAAFGVVNSAIGSYYQAENQKNNLKVQAQNQRFAAQMAIVNQRAAEFTAGQLAVMGQQQIGQYTMRAGQARASARAAMAARGIDIGAGSAGEVFESMDFVKEVDKLTMSASIVRQQEAARLQAFNIGAQALTSQLSAQNLQASAGTIYPGLALGTSLLTGAADIGSTWARNRRIEELLAGVSTQRL